MTPRNGEIAIELETLAPDAAIAQIRASLARSGFGDDTARAPARALAKIVDVDRLVFVDGKAVFVYTLADDRIAQRRSSKQGLIGPDDDVLVVRDERPWYGSKWWLIGGVTVIAAGVATYFVVTANETYSTDRGSFSVSP